MLTVICRCIILSGLILINECFTQPNLIEEHGYPIQPVPFTDVHVQDIFWRGRMEINAKHTIPYAFQMCEETGRIDNFAIAGGIKEGSFSGDYGFNDTDVYKIIEGVAYSLMLEANPQLDQYLDSLIYYISVAREDNGYLYTPWTTRAREINPEIRCCYNQKPWDNLRSSHELYNAGHMYEAAVAHYQATGKRSFLDIALKNADFLCDTFGPGKLEDYSGHQEVEIGLVKLYRVTGDKKYIELAKFFLEQRGREKRLYVENGKLWQRASYSQDHKPGIEQREAVGHAVRAAYMYTAMADIAALTGDKNYLEAIDAIWEDVVSGKLYIIGGIGARPEGEAFGDKYFLPNRDSYNETCAAIANVFWNHRMFLLHGKAKYIDVLERTLYNGLISGVSLDGKAFFYPNPLESEGQSRSPWFSCSCCPSNIVRFLPSLPGYVYAHKDKDIYVNLYISNSSQVYLAGNKVQLILDTDYPWSGTIRLSVNPSNVEKFRIKLRIPGWALNSPVPSDLYSFLKTSRIKVNISVNGKLIEYQYEDGYAIIDREWNKNDKIEMQLPMSVRRIVAHEKVVEDIGKVALQYGPIVYCAEAIDNGGKIFNLVIPDDVSFEITYRSDLLKGINTLTGTVSAIVIDSNKRSASTKMESFIAIPYYAWAHRGEGEMAVWLPRWIEDIRIISTTK